MKKRRAFTIVELVIVIAVIAILATVLIPTFSTVVRKAKDSYIIQNKRNELLKNYAESILAGDNYISAKKENTSELNDTMVELSDLRSKIAESAKTACTRSMYDAFGHELYEALNDDSKYELVGDFSNYFSFSYGEKYNIYCEKDSSGEVQIRFYDDINTSAEESIYYIISAVPKDPVDEQGNPDFETKIVKCVEPQS